MSEKSEASSQSKPFLVTATEYRSTERTGIPASNLIDALRQGGTGSYTPIGDDTARLDWLQNRGRVKARKYGDIKDNFHWDITQADDLRTAIDRAMFPARMARALDPPPDKASKLPRCEMCRKYPYGFGYDACDCQRVKK